MQLSAAQQTILRTHPQSTELYLSIFQPHTVLACSVSGTYARGDREITYKNVTSGSFSGVESGMTLLVGTTQGGRELGKVRVKSATATKIVVAENSHINWPLATYLTVIRFWEVWPIFPRIISDPNNDEDVIFYKDYEIAYTDQNSVLGAFPCAGSHRAGFVGDRFYWSASGTSHLLGSALSYDWAFEGGSVTGSTAETPGYVTYNAAGDYVTRLIVTGANGSTDTTYRYVSIRERPYTSSTNQPIKNWSLQGLAGSRGEGGYSASIDVTNENISINDGDLVVIWSDDWYGSNHVSLGGNGENNSSIFFVGLVEDGSIRYNFQTSVTSFQVGSITNTMKKSEGFSVSVESKPSPAKWFELLDMDSQRALYHYLKWHTTALFLADFQFIGDDRKIQFFDSDRQSMFDAVDNYLRGTLFGNFSADRQGKLWATVNPVGYTVPTSSFPSTFSLSKQDWIGEPVITERMVIPVSSIELGGVAYSGVVTGTYTAHISQAPGVTPNVRGSTETQQGLALTGQAQLNRLSGNVYADKTHRYPTIEIPLNGKYTNFDITPVEAITVTVDPTDTNRGITISAPYLVEGMSWEWNSLSKILTASATLNAIVTGILGATVTIPDIPDDGGYGDGGFGGGFSPIGFPPFLSTLNNTQYLFRGEGDAQDTTGFSQMKEVSFDVVPINYGFALSSGTSTLNTGSYVGRVAVPVPGYYFLNGIVGFGNIANTDGYMDITVGGNVVGFQYASADAGYGGGGTYTAHVSGLAYVTPTDEIKLRCATNSSFVNMSGTLDIILLARLA